MPAVTGWSGEKDSLAPHCSCLLFPFGRIPPLPPDPAQAALRPPHPLQPELDGHIPPLEHWRHCPIMIIYLSASLLVQEFLPGLLNVQCPAPGMAIEQHSTVYTDLLDSSLLSAWPGTCEEEKLMEYIENAEICQRQAQESCVKMSKGLESSCGYQEACTTG